MLCELTGINMKVFRGIKVDAKHFQALNLPFHISSFCVCVCACVCACVCVSPLKQEGYGVIVLNPNENYIEVEKTKAQVQPSSDSSDEPAEKRERKDKIQKDTKKRRDFYEKYRNPQKEKETMQMYIRVSLLWLFCPSLVMPRCV